MHDDVGNELPIVTYRHACSAFEIVKSFFLRSSCKEVILNLPMSYFHV